MRNEPAVILSTVLAAVVALLALLVSFGVDLTGDQQTAIVGAVGAVGSLVVGLITRSLVTPTAKLAGSTHLEREAARRAALHGVEDGDPQPPEDPRPGR